jgi:hypothetical protein
VKDAVKAMKSDAALLDALNNELVPPNLAYDDREDCVMEGIETEEDVAAATGDGEHLPIASTLPGWPEGPLPSVMPRPEMNALRPTGMGPPTVGGTVIGVVAEAPPEYRAQGRRQKDSKPRASRTYRRCGEYGGQNAAECKGGKAGGVATCEHFSELGVRT